MAQMHDTMGSIHSTRRAPTTHSEAVQEAKRLEKLQAHSSSHRSSSPAVKPTVAVKDATS